MGTRQVIQLCLSALMFVPAYAQRQPVIQNAAGDYVIRFEADGEQKEYVFERATHILPSVRVHVERRPEVDAFEYRYTVTNGAAARQEIQSFTITDASAATVMAEPPEWAGDSVLHRGRVYWVRLSKVGRRGIPPGQSVDSFIARSTLLPGPTMAELRGATEVPKVTPIVPESALVKLRTLLERDFVTALTIGPVIAGFTTTEPELTTDVFLARVKNRFAVPLVRSGHPNAREVLEALDRAIAAANGGSGLAEISAVEEIARRSSSLPIVAELNNALVINLEHARSAGR